MTTQITSNHHVASRSIMRIAALLALALSASPVFAQDSKAPGVPSSSEILRQLTPEPPTPRMRGLERGISIERPADRKPPSIDLRVNFESGSAQLTADATTILENLGSALSDPALRTSRFLIAGHTDNVGFDWFNNWLSKQRAQSVADFLINQKGVAASRLEVEGFGRSKLLDPAKPDNPANRRVQIVNLGPAQ